MTDDLQAQLQEIVGTGYRVDRELGGAGMSRVFVATDIELNREVVIKVLPPDLAAGLNVDRFRREIQLAARLQHPHIIPLLSAGAKGSLLYYTMPFIEGENLRARLTRARELPVQEATKIMREVADALSYAHSKGIVHRDIKPENILISGSHALVTDFGVAKALSSATSEAPSSDMTLTSLGMALGTPDYMAPQQAAADPMVDGRADIYALGIVGYELLTGMTPFSGLNQQQTLSAHIVTQPAPITQHRPQLPPDLAAAVMRCVEKRPSDRWQTADELHRALEPHAVTSGATAPVAVGEKKAFQWTPQRIAVAAGIVGLVATGLIASTFAFRRDTPSVSVDNTRQVTSNIGLEVHPAISPDGRFIAYAAGTKNGFRIFVRQLSGGRSIALTDSTVSAEWPKWSPDGSRIVYMADNNRSYVIPAFGGTASALGGDTARLVGCAWANTGDRLACTHSGVGGIVIVDSNGEHRKLVRGTDGNEGFAPSWSPDDKMIAFVRGNSRFLAGQQMGNIAPSSVWVADVDGEKAVRITSETHLNTSPAWTPDGEVLFISSARGNRDVYVHRIGKDLQPGREAQRLTTGVNAHSLTVDRSGKTLAYSVFNIGSNIWTAPVSGSSPMRALTSGTQTIETVDISRDGKWLLYDSNVNGKQDIYKVAIDGSEPQQLTRNGVDNFGPVFSPDGRQIAFHSLLTGNRDIYTMDTSGRNVAAVTTSPREELAPWWGSSAKKIYYLVLPDSTFEIERSGGTWVNPRFLHKGAFVPSRNDDRMLVAGAAGMVCPKCERGLHMKTPGVEPPTRIPTDNMDKVFGNPGHLLWSVSGDAFLSLTERDGTTSIWQLPVNGKPGKRVVHLTDPTRQMFHSMIFSADSSNLYFLIGDRQSDIWTMELKKE